MDYKLKSQIIAAAEAYGLLPNIVYGVCRTESSLNPWAIRYEAKFKWLLRDTPLRPHNCSKETEVMLQKCSWGLMQVTGAVLREQGFEGWLTRCVGDGPEEIWNQLNAGCKHLSAKVRKYGFLEGIAAYNTGTPRLLNGKFVNQDYVDRVLEYAEEWLNGLD